MLASINPLGERARGTTFGRTFAWYVAGSLVAGASAGALLGLVGAGLHALVEPSRFAVGVAVVVVCLVGLLVDVGAGGLRLPTTRRQVNENWLAVYRGWLYGAGFGFQLGVGVVTVVSTAAVYVMLALELLSGSVVGGVAIGATFGFARALPLLVVHGVDEPRELRTMLQRVHHLGRVADVVSRAAIAVLGVAGLAAVAS
jgi:hypothetical protein